MNKIGIKVKQDNLEATEYKEGVGVLIKKKYIRITTGNVPINDNVYTVKILEHITPTRPTVLRWVKSHFINIRKNDLFRIIDPNGQIVKDQQGYYNFMAIKNPHTYDGRGVIIIYINK